MEGETQLDEAAVAIVGLSCRLPGAADPAQFWENLCAGVESIRALSRDEALARGLDPARADDPRWVRAVAAPDDLGAFDAGFFGFSPREAEIMDPQQRLLLECAWETLEDAGYEPSALRGSTGVFAGATTSTYLLFNLLSNAELRATLDPLQLLVGNAVDSLCTRIAYKLGLVGPAFSVQSACSTSLVAVHVACQSLLSHECDLALAGGVSINVSLLAGYRYEPDSIVSPDGHCRAFDARAQGTVFGSGAGMLALKRLNEAVDDGDFIYAVIRGSAANNDGAAKVGYTAPGVEGQTAVIVEALAAAGVEPGSVSYVEAHGTGTSLGDPVEIEALTAAFRGVAPGSCALGTVKTNIGHLDIASGVAGLIKTALALRHGRLPPHLHFERPNPRMRLEGGPFRIPTRLADWPRGAAPRRAGVSSFGFGGTNVHALLEEAPPRRPGAGARVAQLLVLSARSDAALERAATRLGRALRGHADDDLADAAFTLARGRRAFTRRAMLVAASAGVAADALATLDPARVVTGDDERDLRQRTVFLFPGQGAQYAGMGRGLYASEARFREEIDRCAECLARPLGFDLRTLLFPREGERERADQELTRTACAQPALFVVEYALARLLVSWGLEPQALIGHSLGEYVAACLAGVFTLEDALRLVAARGRLMEAAPPGGMLAVPLPLDDVQSTLVPGLEIAALNAPAECVVTGPLEPLAELERACAARGVTCARLRTSHAFHSASMDAAAAAFEHELRQVRLRAPSVPCVSNLSGTWLSAEQATDPAYWSAHLRRTVRFSDSLAELQRTPDRAWLEVGPGRALSSLAARHGWRDCVHALRRRQDDGDDVAALLEAVGRLWVAGQRIDWGAFYAGQTRRRLPLPTYPFERERYWIEAAHAGAADSAAAASRAPARLGAYVPVFKPTVRPATAPTPPRSWLMLPDEGGLNTALAARLQRDGHALVTAEARAADLARALTERAAAGQPVTDVVHAATLVAAGASERFDDATFARGCGALAALAQALDAGHPTAALRVHVITRGSVAVAPGETCRPSQAALAAAALVLAQEHPGVTTRVVDIACDGLPGEDALARLQAELLAAPAEPLVALRGPRRCVAGWEEVPLAPARGADARSAGAYLVVGALEPAACALVERFARRRGARLAVVVPHGFPDDAQRDERPASDDGAAGRACLRRLAAAASALHVVRGALDRADDARALVEQARARLGELHGVIYALDPALDEACALARLDAAQAARRLRAVREIAALHEALRGRTLGFGLVLSSLAAAVGGPGLAPAALAAAAAQAQVAESVRVTEATWLAVSVEAFRAEGVTAPGARHDAEELTDALERLLASGLVGSVSVCSGGPPRPWTAPQAAFAPTALARHARPGLASRYVAPRNATEERIAGIWRELLGLETLGVFDDFFALGGHSLLATQLASRLREAFEVELPLRRLFEGATVAAAAEAILAARAEAAGAQRVAQLLAEIQGLSDEEIERRLAAEPPGAEEAGA